MCFKQVLLGNEPRSAGVWRSPPKRLVSVRGAVPATSTSCASALLLLSLLWFVALCMEDLSSRTRDQTHVPALGAQSLNHGTSRDIPVPLCSSILLADSPEHAGQVISVVSDSLWPQGLQPARLFCPRDSPGRNTCPRTPDHVFSLSLPCAGVCVVSVFWTDADLQAKKTTLQQTSATSHGEGRRLTQRCQKPRGTRAMEMAIGDPQVPVLRLLCGPLPFRDNQ